MKKKKGQILIIVNALMAVLLIYSVALINLASTARQSEKIIDLKTISQNIAEAGIAKAVWCLNQSEGSNCSGTYGNNFAGELDISFGGGIYDTTITTINSNTKSITATGYFPNKTSILSKSIIKISASINNDIASFNYGLQVGQGGVDLKNNVTINGSIYSSGDIRGDNDSIITGDTYVAGGTALTPDQDYSVYNNDFTFGKSNPIVDIAQSFIPSSTDLLNKVSIYIKKVGSPNNIRIRIAEDDNGKPDNNDIASATLSASLVSTNYGWIEIAFNNPPLLTTGNTYWLILDSSENNNKYWKIGTDAFDNYTNGTMLYSEDWDSDPWSASGSDINFKTWLGGIETGISYTQVNGNVYAHNIDHVTIGSNAEGYNITNSNIGDNALANSISWSTIGKNATSTDINNSTVGYSLWCQSYSNTTVGWTNYCPTSVIPPTDPGPVTEPISNSQINDWKTEAQNGGIIEGDYTVNGTESLGPIKINGNLNLTNSDTLNITGTIYVTGDINASNNSVLQLDSSYGNNSGIIMSDGIMTFENNVDFMGADSNSNILVISLYNSKTVKAIKINNNINGAIFYAPDGIMELENNTTIKQLTAYELELENNVILNYEQGLSNITFSSGPSGGWTILPGSWVLIE